MIEALAALLRRLDGNAQRLLHAFLAHIVLKKLRAQLAVDVEVVGRELGRHRTP